MTIASRIAGAFRYLTRATKYTTPDPWEDGWWYGNASESTSAGIDVNQDNSLTYSAVWACVRVISEDLASLPLMVYRRNGRAKERADDHPLYSLLHDSPNPEMTAMQFREAMQMHLLLWGNAYAQIVLNYRGEPMALWPLNPANMEVKRDDSNQLYYDYQVTNSAEHIEFPPDQILHVAGLGYNGLVGLSPITYHCEAIAAGLAGQEMQGSNYKSGAFPSIAISHPSPKAPSEEGRKAFRKSLEAEYSGSQNKGKILTLWEGMKAEALSMSLKDAEFIDSRKFTRTEIAAIFRVPPHKIMDLERATFSNIEQQSISYVVDTIRPWAVRWEQAINFKLLNGSSEYFSEHLVDGLLRGDIQSRYGAYAVGRQWGWMSINDIRQLENMNPIANGDDYLQPTNMRPVGEEPPPAPETEITQDQLEEAARTLIRLKLIGRK